MVLFHIIAIKRSQVVSPIHISKYSTPFCTYVLNKTANIKTSISRKRGKKTTTDAEKFLTQYYKYIAESMHTCLKVKKASSSYMYKLIKCV